MGEPPIRRWSEWGDVFCQNAKETVHVRRECGVQAFCPKGKTLKWAGFACPFESNAGSPQKRELLWGVNHVKHHMDEREIVADYLNTGK